MKPTDKGIDWNRVPASQYDTVSALVTEAATVKQECRLPGYEHRHCFTTEDGHFMCQEKARKALGYRSDRASINRWNERRAPLVVHPYIAASLANALPTRKADQFADHVTSHNPQQEGIAA